MFHQIDYFIVFGVIIFSILVGFIPKFDKLAKLVSKKLNKKQQTKPRTQSTNSDDLDYYYQYCSTVNEDNDKKSFAKSFNRKLRQQQKPRITDANADSQNSSAEKKTNFFVNTISLVVGFQSSISIIGLPVEFYYHGFRSLQFMLTWIVAPIVIFFLVPFIYKIKSKSINEYLDDKFDGSKSVKNMALFLTILFQFVYASLALFSASISIMQIIYLSYPSINLWPIVFCLAFLSAILALLGLKSVVWSNFLQYFVMVGCNVTFVLLGILNFNDSNKPSFTEGLSNLWNETAKTGRGELFRLEENFRYRYTFLNCLIGNSFSLIPTYSFTQQSYMRIKQAKSIRSAQMMFMTLIPFAILNLSIISLLGFVIFGYYNKCGDPISSGIVKNQNQIITKFLSQFFNKYNGLMGLFIGLLINTSINSISNTLKALSVTLSEDIIMKVVSNKKKSSRNDLNSDDYEKNMLNNNNNNTNNNNNGNGNTGLPANNSFLNLHRHRLSSFDQENALLSYEEELQALKYTGLKKKQQKLIKKFKTKDQRFKRKLNAAIILVCGLIVSLTAITLARAPGSIIAVGMSITNSIYGPLFFIFLSARFNEFSMKRTRFALNTSSRDSKLKNIRFGSKEVVISVIVGFLAVQSLFIGQLITYKDANEFYNFDKLKFSPLNKNQTQNEFCRNDPVDSVKFFQTRSNQKEETSIIESEFLFTNSFPLLTATTTTTTTTQEKTISKMLNKKSKKEIIKFYNYLFGISFYWYPFIGFFITFFLCILLSLLKFLFFSVKRKLLSKIILL